MKKCVYCGSDEKNTREHIISNSILSLFPECYLTFDYVRNCVHKSDPVVNDVCKDCNSTISYIDAYAGDLIDKYFIKNYEKDDELDFEYDYTMIQKMLIKFAYNDIRAHRDDVSFFTDKIKEFILNKNIITEIKNVTILAGITTNTTPISQALMGNEKLSWSKNPMFLKNSILEYVDPLSGKVHFREKLEEQEFKKMEFSYFFKFNSVQFILICWKIDITKQQLEENEVILKYQYPYIILDSTGRSILRRCTSALTYHNPQIIDVTWRTRNG